MALTRRILEYFMQLSKKKLLFLTQFITFLQNFSCYSYKESDDGYGQCFFPNERLKETELLITNKKCGRRSSIGKKKKKTACFMS